MVLFPNHKRQYKQTPNQKFRYDAFGDHERKHCLLLWSPHGISNGTLQNMLSLYKLMPNQLFCSYNTYYGNTPFPKVNQTWAKERAIIKTTICCFIVHMVDMYMITWTCLRTYWQIFNIINGKQKTLATINELLVHPSQSEHVFTHSKDKEQDYNLKQGLGVGRHGTWARGESCQYCLLS